MRIAYKFLFVLVVMGVLGSCKKFEDLLEDPLLPTPESADVDLYLNSVQLSFQNFFNGVNDNGIAFTRMEAFFGPTYASGVSPEGFSGIWSTAYTGVIKQADAMIPVAKQQGRFVHAGIAQILKAYTLMTLVDGFGDVPLSEANLGVENTNPKIDLGRDVYNAALALLDTAIADLNRTGAGYPAVDLFGYASAASWRRVAKTLKFRAFLNTRLVDNTAKAKIEALLTEGDIITTDAQEWTFRFGSRQSTPNNRHPKYNANYVASGGASDYIGTYFMYALVEEKPVPDPRRRYYFYRQTTNTPGNIQQQPCAFGARPAHYSSNDPFCYFITAPGYWGRDHGDASGIPPDGDLRTTWGAYPAGGRYDNNNGQPTSLNTGGQGAGIWPLWMSWFTDFTRAELALTLGVTGNPRALLESGVRKSIKRVLSFPTEIGVSPAPTQGVPTTAQIDAYVRYVLEQYDAATTNDAKLDVVLKEYYIALWGNGFEAYNMYRRTCRPRNLQPAISANPGGFIRSFLYPSNFVNLNINAKQKPDVTQKVFWDTNPATGCTF